MIKQFLMSLILMVSFSAQAQTDSKRQLIQSVNVEVKDCQTGVMKRKGHATLFKLTYGGEETYGLTTFGTVLSGTDILNCVTGISDETGAKSSGRVVRTSYPMGLAIIKFDQSVWTSEKEDVAPLNFWARKATGLSEVNATWKDSFPGVHAKIIMYPSERHTFFQPGKAGASFLEAMSDEALPFDARGGLIAYASSSLNESRFTYASVGLVTDDYIELVPGSMSQVHAWDEASRPQKHLVLARLERVEDFVEQALNTPQVAVRYFPSEKDPRVLAMETDGLILEPSCPPETERFHPSGDFPIGGNNGHGVGGEDLTGPLCKILIRQGKNPAYADHGIMSDIHGGSDWLDKIRLDLRAVKQLEAWYFINSEERRYGFKLGIVMHIPLRKQGFSSLSGFLRLLNTDDEQVVLEASQSGRRPTEYIRNDASLKLIRDTQKLLLGETSIESNSLVEFRRYVFMLTSLLQSNQWKAVHSSDIGKSFHDNGDGEFQFAEAWDLMDQAFGKPISSHLLTNLKTLSSLNFETLESSQSGEGNAP